MKVAVTGSSGLIGTALTTSLRADGHEVIRLVRRAPPTRSAGTRAAYAGLIASGGDQGQPGARHASAGGRAGQARCAVGHLGRGVGHRLIRRHRRARPTSPRHPGRRSSRGWSGTGRRPPGWPRTLASAACTPAGAWSSLPAAGCSPACFRWSGWAGWAGASGSRPAANLTAPAPATNSEFTAALTAAIGRRDLPWLRVPAWALLRLALGEAAVELLTSARILPSRLQEAGYEGRYPTLPGAVSAELASA